MNQKPGSRPTLSLPASTEPGGWLLVDAVELLWVVPRHEAVHLGERFPERGALPACGRVDYRGRGSVLTIYWDRRLRPSLPEEGECHSALILQTGLGTLALACRRLLRLEQAPRFYQLPRCMQGRRHMFDQVAVVDGRTAAKVDTEQLLQWLPDSLQWFPDSQDSSLRG